MSDTPGTYWPRTPGEWQVAMACEANMQRFERAMDDLLHSSGATATQAREAAEALLKLAAGAKSVTVHIPAGVWPADDEPFLRPDYIAAPVNGAPGEPIALMRREGGAV